jgi:hypothetical protein
MLIRAELVGLDQTGERLLDELFALVDVVEDFAAQNKVAAVYRYAIVAHRSDRRHEPLIGGLDEVKALSGANRREGRDPWLALELGDHLVDRHVGQAVRVVRQKNRILAEVLPHA